MISLDNAPLTSYDLGLAFGKWRTENGLTLRDIQAKTDISNAFLSQFEQGTKGISYDFAIKIIQLMQNAEIEKTVTVRGRLK